ncbi:MAG TPA: AraC family transcriptional regulator [Gammaproteobacteria bacterium]|nr:AraC family transcriptional regulator [Gammaproteobacteria bacterium]
MNPVNTAVWYIERHFASELSLAEIASACGASPFYLTRAFAALTGHSLMRYVRARRLSTAALELASGAPDILTVALAAGYGSHEAFTRAFRDQFGVTPEAVREGRSVDGIELTEAVSMDQTLLDRLEPPRIVDGKPLLIAGLDDRYTSESSAGIPGQWQRLTPWFGRIPGQSGYVSYGVSHNVDDDGNFDYICGVEVPDFSNLPAELDRLRIPAHKYAVFTHREHISTFRRTYNTIWSVWLPESGYESSDAPNLERYPEEFDGATGLGGVEIWVPIE